MWLAWPGEGQCELGSPVVEDSRYGLVYGSLSVVSLDWRVKVQPGF